MIIGKQSFFPTEPNPAKEGEFRDASIRLGPGETYQVFWTTKELSSSTARYGLFAALFSNQAFEHIKSELSYVFFLPGEYTLFVETKYWTDGDTSKPDYRLATGSIKTEVAAPQFVILLGAAIGGLICYWIFPQVRAAQQDEIAWLLPVDSTTSRARMLLASAHGLTRRLVGASIRIFGVILLSMIITILLSRVSETQFLIRVTVNDIWGAVAIGFVAAYTGSRFLKRLLDRDADRGDDSGQKAARSSLRPGPQPEG